MAKGGYVGKILYVNLTDRSTDEIPTEKYEKWIGGHGMGAALFFDYCKDKTVNGFDPENVVCFNTSPFSGTITPSASGRTEVTGIGVHSYPKEWFTRSNFGGRFSGMLKFSGFDGIVIQGKADKPVWINIVNGKVTIEDATDLWGLDTHETQEEIWKSVTGQPDVKEWWDLGSTRDSGRSTQKPAVVCIGPAGENLVRGACLLHDAGNSAGQGGFGAVLGSKNLKAISTIGTGNVPVADPAALMDLRMEIKDKFGFNPDNPTLESPVPSMSMFGVLNAQPGYAPLIWAANQPARPQGCMGCFKNCRMNFKNGVGNGNICVEGTYWMASGDQMEHMAATSLLDKVGLNVYDVGSHNYLLALYKQGILGKGKQIDTDLPFDKYETYEFIEKYTWAITNREGIGDDLAEGYPRAAEKWGRWEEDTKTGLLPRPNWGYAEHYDPRVEVEWSYGSILGDRDINEHGVNWHVHWMPMIAGITGTDPLLSAEELAERLAEASLVGDPKGWDYSAEGVYGDAKVAAVQWHRHYSRFWIQSMLMCDWAWPHLVNYNAGDDHVGATPDFEPRLYKAVTGNEMSMEDSLEMGRKIFTLDKAIWVLQGRERDMEMLADYVFEVPTSAPYPLPVFEDGEWKYDMTIGRTLDRDKFETVKDRFYALEGWEVATGYPSAKTLKDFDMGDVSKELEAAKKLGKDS